MFGKRLISGIILVILALIFVVTGGSVLLAVTEIISLIGLFELYRALKIHNSPMGMVGYLAAVGYFGLLWASDTSYMMLVFIGFLMVCMTIYVVTFPKYKTEEVTGAVFGLFYVPVMLSYLYQTREMPDGIYLVGMLFGKHRLAPVLSPKKSIEGAVGGVVGAALLGFFYAGFFKDNIMNLVNPQAACAIACGIAAVISQIGDLAASAIKRNHDIKDYGHLIPGHGGILDRFDSMIFTAPAIFFAVNLLDKLF